MGIHVRETNSFTSVNLTIMDLNIQVWVSHPISTSFWVEFNTDDMFGLRLT